MATDYKRCLGPCGKVRPLDDFHRDASTNDGRRSRCRSCRERRQDAGSAESLPPGTKRCAGPCGQVRSLDLFNRDAGKLDGRRSRCRFCSNPAGWRPPEVLPPGHKRCAGPCGEVKAVDEFWRNNQGRLGRESRCIECVAPVLAAERAANRAAVFGHYGTRCACCGTTEALSIDHLGGGGASHRKQLGVRGGSTFYRWLIKHGFPPGFQTLCQPCNQSKSDGPACRLDHG